MKYKDVWLNYKAYNTEIFKVNLQYVQHKYTNM